MRPRSFILLTSISLRENAHSKAAPRVRATEAHSDSFPRTTVSSLNCAPAESVSVLIDVASREVGCSYPDGVAKIYLPEVYACLLGLCCARRRRAYQSRSCLELLMAPFHVAPAHQACDRCYTTRLCADHCESKARAVACSLQVRLGCGLSPRAAVDIPCCFTACANLPLLGYMRVAEEVIRHALVSPREKPVYRKGCLA